MRIICVVAVAGLVARAAADPVDEANALAARGDFANAALKFREAYRADPRPDHVCSVGVSYYKAADYQRAQLYLSICLDYADSLDAGFVENVRKAFAAVEAKLKADGFGSLDLAVDPKQALTTIAGAPFDDPVPGSRRIWLRAGHYDLTVRSEGYVERAADAEVRAGDAIAKAIALVPTIAPARPVTPPPPAPTPVDTDHTLRNAILASSLTVALGGVAALTYWRATVWADRAGNATDIDTYNNRKDSALSFEHASWVLGGIAGAGAVVSGYLWYRVARAPTVEVTPSGATVSIAGTF